MLGLRLKNKSLSLIMMDALAHARKALKILREYYAVKGKPHIINLKTMLTMFQKTITKTVMGYTVRAETVITLQHGEILGDRLLIAELQDLSLLSRRNDGENLGAVAHSDADCAADANDRCSTTGYRVSLSKNSFLISWKTGGKRWALS